MTQTEQRLTDEQIHLSALAQRFIEEGKLLSATWCHEASAKIGELMRALDEQRIPDGREV